MKKFILILFLFFVWVTTAWAWMNSGTGTNIQKSASDSCAGGTDGYIGNDSGGGWQAACGATCTTNYLHYSKFVVETDTNQEDGTITYAHWDTQYANASTRAGIWNSDGELVIGTAEQEGSDGNPDAFNVSVTSTCLAAGTYYAGVWIEGDAWANSEQSGWVSSVWTRRVEMATFGDMCGTPDTCGSETTANGRVAVWFDNSSGR